MKILVTRHDKIGDFITALPLCYVLKQGSHHITMLVLAVNVPLAKELDFIDEVIEYTKDTKALIDTIKSYNFDVSISAFIDMDLGKVLFKAKIPKRIAPATKLAQIFFNKRIKQRRSEVKMREFEYNLDLAHALDKSLDLSFPKPLWNITKTREDFIIFHVGSGGSSEGNLTLDDYLSLGKIASAHTKIVFSFGRDDQEDKDYIQKNLDFKAELRDDFKTIVELTQFIAKSKLFISTSTGPMHLAGLSNTPTLSFFGESLFASSKRWATISDEENQYNFELPLNYKEDIYKKIEKTLMELI